MKAFDEYYATLTRALAELGQLEERRLATRQERHVKQQEIGRLCYEAEEDLGTQELNTLKRMLVLSESQWRTYKAKCIAGSSSGDLT
jgi:hypothetical protein